MIVITGATGELGRSIVENLLERVPAANVGVSVRDPEKAADLEKKGARVAQGDFTKPSTLAEAFEGAEQVLIISVNVLGEEAVRQHGNAIQAAKDAGAKRILYTSHQAASPSSAVPFARDHAATEVLLQSSGVPYVSLRNGFYGESALYQLGGMKESGRLALPEDGPVSWTARTDLAEAAVAALTDKTLFDGVSPALTAAEAILFSDIASLASEVLGRDIKREVISEEEYRGAKLSAGYPEPVVDMLASLFAATRAREFDVVDPTLERLLGRKPTSMRAILTKFLQQAKSNINHQ
jgi:uncharacterized protein YbjT (DUF2867 family)